MPGNFTLTYRSWFKVLIFGSVFWLCLIAVFNYTRDSAGLFGSYNKLAYVAESLLAGRMVAGLKDYDERSLQKMIIEKTPKKVDTILLGSSRALHVRKSAITKEADAAFFNHSVSGASLEDFIAIIGVYEKVHHYIPRRVIIAVDPWVFNKKNQQNRWKSLDIYYNFVAGRLTGHESPAENLQIIKAKQLINKDYTIANIEYCMRRDHEIYITGTTNINDTIKEPDGSVHYPLKQRLMTEEEVGKAALDYAQYPVYSLEGFTVLSHTELFEKFIDYLKQQADVLIVLMPYHPVTYDALVKKTDYRIIRDVETYLRDMASRKQINLAGSYDPARCKARSKDFFDGMHPKEIVVQRIFDDHIRAPLTRAYH